MPSFLEKHATESVNLATSGSSPYEPPHRKSQEKSWFFGARPIGAFTDGLSKGDVGKGGRSSESDHKELVDSKPQILQSLPNGTPRSSTDRLGRLHSKADSNPSLPNNPTGVYEKNTKINGESSSVQGPAAMNQAPPVMDGTVTHPTKADLAAPNQSSQDGSGRRSVHARGHSSSAPQSPSSYIIKNSTTDVAQGTARTGTDPPANRKESQSTGRFSSPPTSPQSSENPINPSAAPVHPGTVRLQHRHTLQVPKLSTGRTSRDFPLSMSSSSDHAPIETERLSPTQAGRGSLSLGRRPTRSIHSDVHLDEAPQGDDMARWTETIRQKRASRRKRKDEEEDDRVVVGTKVDMNHVNWVTAYNMLTGIRFTVSRTNAKIDRDLTDGDFDAQHKFSFDM